MILLEKQTNKGINSIKFIGELNFNQKISIFPGQISKNIYFKNLLNKTNHNPYDINTIYNEYLKQNITNTYEYEYFEQFLSSDDIEKYIDVEVNIPNSQKIQFVPSYLHTFKEAWIQYFCLFVPVYLVLRILLFFLLNSGVFHSYIFSMNKSIYHINIKHKID